MLEIWLPIYQNDKNNEPVSNLISNLQYNLTNFRWCRYFSFLYYSCFDLDRGLISGIFPIFSKKIAKFFKSFQKLSEEKKPMLYHLEILSKHGDLRCACINLCHVTLLNSLHMFAPIIIAKHFSNESFIKLQKIQKTYVQCYEILDLSGISANT